ncbi:MAG: hypothetical protein KGY70_08510 [Bacteroidales bacterium]|nr:hypothetical protein [Bacteroidales bacterium]
MSNNEMNSQELNNLREQKESSEKKIFLAKERLRKISAQEEKLNRYFNPDNKEHLRLQRSLLSQKEETENLISSEENELANINDSLQSVWENFIPFTDPKQYLQRLDESYPVLLVPLRIETRFKKVRDEYRREKDQLWVRVYPDDCSIDTFEETLSESEIRDAQIFWMDWWIAAGRENLRRAAWKRLVDGHGHGRAQYIFNNYRPENFEEILHSGEDLSIPAVFLVINGKSEIKEDEKSPLARYWESFWRAQGDPEQINQAKSELDEALGEERATYLAGHFAPKNIDEKPPVTDEDSTINIEVKFIEFKSESETESQQQTWSQAPKVRIMPERLYLLAYRNDNLEVEEIGETIPFPLIVGPDPGVKEEEDLEEIPGTDVKVTPDMRWMIDFEDAVSKGMAFKVDLTPEQAKNGFDKLFVLGVKMSSDRMKAKEEFEELIYHHYYGNSGFGFLPVGTPTNNTLESGSGYSESEDADESFDLIFKNEPEQQENETNQWWAKSDRQWFAEMLGISEEVFDNTINTDGYDQREARAMNVSLWQTTWGYFFETMLEPVLSETEIEQIRWYFNHFVTGRGSIPSVRIDDQPYGILLTTAFSKISWINEKQLFTPQDIANEVPRTFRRFLPVLYSKFQFIQEDWMKMVDQVSFVGKEGDPHQLLLDILGLHGGSVEFHKRLGESMGHIFNLYKSSGGDSVTMEEVFKALFNSIGGQLLLSELGYTGEESPEIFEKLFVLNAEKLTGPLIDDLPLSETNPVRTYSNGTEESGPENYIQWFIRVAGESFDKLRKEEGFIDGIRPNALLYLMLKHALEQSYWDAGVRLYHINEVWNGNMIKMARKEPDFIHIRPPASDTPMDVNRLKTAKPLDYPFRSESRYNLLYEEQPAITGQPDMIVADYIPTAVAQNHFATRYLSYQLNALKLLANSPTARLERLLIEHIDCASYRFDAWKNGILNYQLKALRNRPEVNYDYTHMPRYTTENVNKGLYIGAYGWLENVKSENKVLTPVELDPELEEIFGSSENGPVYRDSENLGFINAPSLNHAVTAAILRNGYLSRAGQDNAEAFNINLSSERVRKALQIIEGIQNGQNLAALLGYQFEREIHDNNVHANVDHLVFKIRRKFPLGSNQMNSTYVDEENVSIDALEARNVVHGLDLIKFAENNLGPNDEPLYFDDLNVGTVTANEKNIIVEAINNIRDINDAVADLAFAESIHQVVQGNIDRAAGTLDTFSTGNYPQIPEVIQTPRSGVNITQRLGLQIEANADPTLPGFTPRAMAEPGLNHFLQDILPELQNIMCYVTFFHHPSNAEIREHPVSMADLQLQPIDLLFLINNVNEQAMDSLDDRIVHYILNTGFPTSGGPLPPRPDADIRITYFKSAEDKVSVFELASLMKHLKAILLRSRALQPSDVIKSNEAEDSVNSSLFLDKQRIDLVLNYLNTPKSNLDSFVNNMESSLGEGGDDEATIISNIDDRLETFVGILQTLALLGIPQTGIGFAYDWRKRQLKRLFGKFHELIDIWEQKEDEFSTLLSDYDTLATDEEKIKRLLRAERVISTQTTLEPGTDPEAFKTNVIDVKKASFDQRKQDFEDFLNDNHMRISDALDDASTPLSYEAFHLVPTDIADIENACLDFAGTLLTKAKQLKTDIEKRTGVVNSLLVQHDSEVKQPKKIRLLQDAAKQLLTEEFKMIPSFEIPQVHMAEWQKAMGKVDELLDYQTTKKENPLPVDEWFYGVARVREKTGHMEQSVLMAESFKPQTIELTPVQFPLKDPYCWFAMEFGHDDPDKNDELNTVFQENDHLLYTAYYHESFDPSKYQCGLLIDEWTEVVPTKEETTGVAFHYDRPDSEPPQTMLLAMSPQLDRGGWRWQDLIDILHETLQEAKLRAVEPEQIDKTGYANLIPATISTVTKYPVSIMLNYAFNNQPLTNIQTIENE